MNKRQKAIKKWLELRNELISLNDAGVNAEYASVRNNIFIYVNKIKEKMEKLEDTHKFTYQDAIRENFSTDIEMQDMGGQNSDLGAPLQDSLSYSDDPNPDEQRLLEQARLLSLQDQYAQPIESQVIENIPQSLEDLSGWNTLPYPDVPSREVLLKTPGNKLALEASNNDEVAIKKAFSKALGATGNARIKLGAGALGALSGIGSAIADAGGSAIGRGLSAVKSGIGDIAQNAGEYGVDKAANIISTKLGDRYPWLKEMLGPNANKEQKALGMAYAAALGKRNMFVPTNVSGPDWDQQGVMDRLRTLTERDPEDEKDTVMADLALQVGFAPKFNVENSELVWKKPESFKNFIGRNAEEEKRRFLPEGVFTEEEINTRRANNPLEARYLAQLDPYVMKHKEDRRNEIINKLDKKYWANNNYEGVSREMNNLFERDVINPLIGQMREEFLDPHKGVLHDVANKMIRTGNYGSSVHGRLAMDAARNFEKDMMQKVGALRGQAYQQSAQIHSADRDAAFRQNVARGQLFDQEMRHENQQEQNLEGIANKIQHERQQQLGHAWARKREEEEMPMQELAQMQRVRDGQQYQPVPDFPVVLPEQHRGFQGLKTGGGVTSPRTPTRAMNPKDMAQLLMKKGRHGDTMLAHINPVEAAFLKALGGSGSVNPKTGIPEFWDFNDLMGLAKRGVDIASFIGGKGLGSNNYTAKLNALPFNIGTPTVGGTQTLGGALGRQGFSSIPVSDVGLDQRVLGSDDGVEKNSTGNGGGFLNGLGNFLSDHGTDLISLGANIYDANERRKQERAIMRQQQDRFEYQKRVAELMQKGMEKRAAEQKAAKELEEAKKQKSKAERLARRARILGGEYDSNPHVVTEPLVGVPPQLGASGYSSRYDGGPRLTSPGIRMNLGTQHRGGAPTRGMAKGGRVKRYADGGYVKGNESGIKDNIPVQIPEGSYVLDALTVSLLGDGNSDAGAREFERLKQYLREKENSYYDGGMYNKSALDRYVTKQAKAGGEISRVRGKGDVHAVVSQGEVIVPPEEVLLFSRDGSLDDGARRLDKFRSKLRKSKGLPQRQKLLPKTKALKAYL